MVARAPPDYGCPDECDGSEAFHPSLLAVECTICGKSFPSEAALSVHLAEHPLLAFAPKVDDGGR